MEMNQTNNQMRKTDLQLLSTEQYGKVRMTTESEINTVLKHGFF